MGVSDQAGKAGQCLLFSFKGPHRGAFERAVVDGESFYGTVLHEMTHSTGSESRLNRLKAAKFGDKDYGREELVAELGSALVCQQNGIHKHSRVIPRPI